MHGSTCRLRGGPLSGATVDSELLDPTRGFREGSATLTRDFALLARLGPYTLEGNNRLLDDKWQYPRTHLNENVQRRVPVLYQLAKAPASLVSAYVQAVTAVAEAPFRDMLRPLDNDDEFLYYASLLGWGGPPNFYPRLPAGLLLGPEEDGRLRRPTGRPYSSASHADDQRLHIPLPARDRERQGSARRPAASVAWASDRSLRKEIRQLEQKIKQLEQFLQRLEGTSSVSRRSPGASAAAWTMSDVAGTESSHSKKSHFAVWTNGSTAL